jgi:outer membrane protein assembly factor BamB
MFLHDLGRSDYDPAERAITPGNVRTLTPVWSVNARAAISDQIASVGGVDYWGSWNGDVHATDQSTGRQLWKAQLGSETNHHCYPAHIGIVSSPEVATVPVAGVPTQVVFIGGGNGRFYALDARTGRTIWSDFFGSPSAGYFLWSSPALFRGNLYFGVASVGSCPNIPGELVEADPSTGAIEASLPTSPAGCVGAGVWELPHDRHLQRQHLLRDRQRLRVLPAA